VHTHVREDALQLYGFASRDERSVFALLIGISGVGPKMALAILSGIGVEELRESVHRQDRGRLQKIPGVGKKTAERLLLELRDKLGAGSGHGQEDHPAGGDGHGEPAGLRADAISALVNLGYSRDVARRAVERAVADREPSATLESVLRAALAGLVR
jgi:Holliday junction DNA helicase RuvA